MYRNLLSLVSVVYLVSACDADERHERPSMVELNTESEQDANASLQPAPGPHSDYWNDNQHKGNEVGNGGGVMLCETSAEALDYYEARTLRGIQIDLGPESSSVEQKISVAIARLDRLDTVRAAAYAEEAGRILREMNLNEGALPEINDRGQVYVPPHCQVVQAALQRKPHLPRDPRYVFNRPVWERLDATQRAGLVLHEVIYRDALQRGHDDSVRARYFNSILSSKEIEALDAKGYAALLRDSWLGEYVLTKFYAPTSTYMRFISESPMTLAEAEEFCSTVEGASKLWEQTDWAYEYMKGSDLGDRILAVSGAPNASIWVKRRYSGTYTVVANAYSFGKDAERFYTASPDEKNYALCQTERE